MSQHVEERGCLRFGHLSAIQGLHTLAIAAQLQQAFAAENTFPVLNILRNIQNDRPRPIAARNFKSRANRRFEFFRIEHQKRALRARAHDVEDRRLLKRVGADGCARNLSADQNYGHRIGHAVANRRHAVRRART